MTVALFRKKKKDDGEGKDTNKKLKIPFLRDPMPEIHKQMEEQYGVEAVKNFLDMVPEITVKWTEKECCIGIYNERFQSERWRKVGKLFGLNRYYFVRIRAENKYGQFIWHHIDGKRTVREIGVAMFAEFSEDETLSFQRVKMFLDRLKRINYIRFVEPPGESEESGEEEAKAQETEDSETVEETSQAEETPAPNPSPVEEEPEKETPVTEKEISPTTEESQEQEKESGGSEDEE